MVDTNTEVRHTSTILRMELPERIRSKFAVAANGCWEWTASMDPAGYGRVGVGRSNRLAHRVVYEMLVGPVPDGLTLDHLCRVRHCVNPEHLEPVTMRTNILRGVGPSAVRATQTHCKHGHEFTPENTARDKNNNRRCRTCARISTSKINARRWRTDPEYRERLLDYQRRRRAAKRAT